MDYNSQKFKVNCKNIENNFTKWVHLPKIYSKLFLGNFFLVNKYCEHNKFDYIINLCEQKLPQRQGSNIFNFSLSDDDGVSYEYFKYIMLQAVNLMKEAENRGATIEVNCAAGINRSCSVIVAYAVLVKGWNVNDAISYIKYEKNKKHGYRWGTLTNDTFIRYLHQIQREFQLNY